MKRRNINTAAIIALILAVTGLAIGFAAFSRTFTISSSAGVSPNSDDFKVQISSSKNSVNLEDIEPVLSTEIAGFTAEPAVIGEDALTLTNLKANFTAPGQNVRYTFYVRNTGKYQAYRNNIIFKTIDGESRKICTAEDDANEDLVNEACKGMNVTVTYNNGNITDSLNNGSYQGCDQNGINVDGYDTIVVEISYSANASRADGPFTVEFGDIEFEFGSVASCSGGAGEPA